MSRSQLSSLHHPTPQAPVVASVIGPRRAVGVGVQGVQDENDGIHMISECVKQKHTTTITHMNKIKVPTTRNTLADITNRLQANDAIKGKPALSRAVRRPLSTLPSNFATTTTTTTTQLKRPVTQTTTTSTNTTNTTSQIRPASLQPSTLSNPSTSTLNTSFPRTTTTTTTTTTWSSSTVPITTSFSAMQLDSDTTTTSLTNITHNSDDTIFTSSTSPMSISDIDALDMNDAQAVATYIEEIMEHLREREVKWRINATYMKRQTDINFRMREILVDWLVEVHLKFKLEAETLYLTINLIDRFLERRAVARDKLQLVGCTAMLIASKYEEIHPPEIRDFVFISDKAYTREQILAMESIMLTTLQFNITVPYALSFAQRFAKLCGCWSSPVFRSLLSYLLESTLQDHKFLIYLPSTIAAAAMHIANHTLKAFTWTARHDTFVPPSSDLSLCITDLYTTTTQDSKYRAVKKKYSTAKFHAVATMTIQKPMNERTTQITTPTRNKSIINANITAPMPLLPISLTNPNRPLDGSANNHNRSHSISSQVASSSSSSVSAFR